MRLAHRRWFCLALPERNHSRFAPGGSRRSEPITYSSRISGRTLGRIRTASNTNIYCKCGTRKVRRSSRTYCSSPRSSNGASVTNTSSCGPKIPTRIHSTSRSWILRRKRPPWSSVWVLTISNKFWALKPRFRNVSLCFSFIHCWNRHRQYWNLYLSNR